MKKNKRENEEDEVISSTLENDTVESVEEPIKVETKITKTKVVKKAQSLSDFLY